MTADVRRAMFADAIDSVLLDARFSCTRCDLPCYRREDDFRFPIRLRFLERRFGQVPCNPT
jgi:hypothetical protein